MKNFLKNKEEFNNFVQIITNDKTGIVSYLDNPKIYPCILIWTSTIDIINNQKYVDGQYVYLSDFKNN